ncbi:MAG TPA: TolC family protein [Spirochaetia bacterium]|nr:TolC family protein [Spirochaetia bacterium]
MTASAHRALPFILLLAPAVLGQSQAQALTLDQAVELARKNSDAIQIARLAVQKSRAALGEARGRALPHLDFQASASYLINPPPGYTVAPGALGTFAFPIPVPPFSTTIQLPQSNFNVGAALHNLFSVTATLNQPLFTWGKIRNAIELASLQLDAAGTDMSARRRDIDMQVRRSYFSALLAGRSRDVLKRLRDTAAEIVADRQKGFDEGTLNKESLLEVKATLASLEAKLIEAEQSQSSALTGLGVLTGQSMDDLELATDFSSSLPSLDEQVILTLALEGSPEMAAARSQAERARRRLSIEEGGAILHPDVNFGISLDVSGQEDFPYSGAWTFSNNTWNVDVALTLGIKMSAFDGLESLHRIQQAQKDIDMAGVALSQETKTLRIQVRQAIETARKGDAAAQAAIARSEYLEEKLRNATVALANGQASLEDRRKASLEAGSAQLDLLLALYDREAALADIQRITGERP